MNMRPKRQRGIDSLTAAAMLVLAVSCGCSSESAKPQSGQGAPASSTPSAAPGSAPGASAQAPETPEDAAAPSDAVIADALTPWTGDLDGMVARRYIRVLVTLSKTNYYLDRGKQYGATYDAGKAFEDFLNARLRSKNIRVHLAFIPVSRDRIFQALAEGRGDIAAARPHHYTRASGPRRFRQALRDRGPAAGSHRCEPAARGYGGGSLGPRGPRPQVECLPREPCRVECNAHQGW